MRKEEHDQASRSRRSVYGRKRNRCVISPANASTMVVAIERREHSWFFRTNDTSDLTVFVGETIFHLHKLPMVSKSGYFSRLIFQRRKNGETNSTLNIDNFPGGYHIFHLVVKFCYGLAIDLTATNVAPLYSAAHFLEMTEDFQHGNLISNAEAFLSFIVFSAWKDTLLILKSCEDVSLRADKLEIVKQCSESIAWKACLDPQVIGCSVDDELCLNSLSNNTKNLKYKNDSYGNIVEESWWFEDVSILRIDHFVEVINVIKAKGMKPKLVGGSIAYWISKWLQKIKNVKDCDHKEVRGDTFECLIRILPKERNSVCCNFLLHLLKVGLMLNIDPELTMELDIRVATMLESLCAEDLLVKNFKDGDTMYDVSLVIRVVDAYATYISKDPKARLDTVAGVVDDYLALVARDGQLLVECFQLLAEALPEDARSCNDKLYRAMDMYLKAHPTLTEEERRTVCRSLKYHKLSQEARNHAMKNDRLPVNITLLLILWEQVKLTKSTLSKDMKYKRSKPKEVVIERTKELDDRWLKPLKELQTMKTDVEKMKVQLSNLQVVSLKLQRQVGIGLR
ncbi:Coleoptile phototropism protein [Thalictrum thalictroides]|uniref:Coleoptile phototropism protein n=1 Tax=Thalictrum thalictroides TaxID=46969 RepID=A0A7J6WEP5_THATH|nr:Coleoptile phototropism protein [Thalictrum thalictroides]